MAVEMLSAELAHRDEELAALSARLKTLESPSTTAAAGLLHAPAPGAEAPGCDLGSVIPRTQASCYATSGGESNAGDAPGSPASVERASHGSNASAAEPRGASCGPYPKFASLEPAAAAGEGRAASAAPGEAADSREEVARLRREAAALRGELALAETLRAAQAAQLAAAHADLAALCPPSPALPNPKSAPAANMAPAGGRVADASLAVTGFVGVEGAADEGLAEFLQQRLKEAGAELAARDGEIARLRAALAGAAAPAPAATPPNPDTNAVHRSGSSERTAGEAAIAALQAQAGSPDTFSS